MKTENVIVRKPPVPSISVFVRYRVKNDQNATKINRLPETTHIYDHVKYKLNLFKTENVMVRKPTYGRTDRQTDRQTDGAGDDNALWA